jgi:hypothetical protein
MKMGKETRTPLSSMAQFKQKTSETQILPSKAATTVHRGKAALTLATVKALAWHGTVLVHPSLQNTRVCYIS